MSRVKTQAEIDQEARDEALARQLSEEYERQAHAEQQQEHRQSVQRPPRGQDGYPGHQFSMQQGGPRAHGPRGSIAHNQVLCGNCRAVNNIVSKPEAQQLCGHCHRVLAKPSQTQPQQQHQQQQQPQAPQVGAPSETGGIIQGTVLPASVQVKCGQCAAINAIPAPAANAGEPQVVSFRCGQCQAVNQVSV